MLIERTERGLKIRTPAKLNLFLDVLGKRTDGYHQIDTIMCPVGLWDELEFEPTDSSLIEFSIARCHQQSEQVPSRGQANQLRAMQSVTEQSVPGSASEVADPAWEIPAGDSNLVVRALASVRDALALRAEPWQANNPLVENRPDTLASLPAKPIRGCRVQLTKQIPAAAGLGGGSSDAAAAIVAGMWMWADHWDRALAIDIASKLGSDIPLFLGDEHNGIGLARATGRGEHVEILTGRPALCFVISHPPVGSSTAEVYRLWRNDGEIRSSTQGPASQLLDLLSGNEVNPQNQQADLPSQRSQELSRAIERLMVNALQRPASQLNPWIEKQLDSFAQLGKSAAMMSGSGSACFTLCSDLDEGRTIVEKLIELGMPRAYAAQAWYAASIEQQLERITSYQR